MIKPKENAETDMSASSASPQAAPQIYKPSPQECALLVLDLVAQREIETDKNTTRLRLAEISLKRLCGRQRLDPRFIDEVNEWLLGAGFSLFFAGTTYALVRTSAVEGWPRTTSKRLSATLSAVASGTFDFRSLHHLLVAAAQPGNDDA